MPILSDFYIANTPDKIFKFSPRLIGLLLIKTNKGFANANPFLYCSICLHNITVTVNKFVNASTKMLIPPMTPLFLIAYMPYDTVLTIETRTAIKKTIFISIIPSLSIVISHSGTLYRQLRRNLKLPVFRVKCFYIFSVRLIREKKLFEPPSYYEQVWTHFIIYFF